MSDLFLFRFLIVYLFLFLFHQIRKMIEASDSGKCAFSNCLHLGELGCVVDGKWERYPFYLQLLDEIRIREEFQLRTFGTKREGDVRFVNKSVNLLRAAYVRQAHDCSFSSQTSMSRFVTLISSLQHDLCTGRFKMGQMGVQQAEPRLELKKHRRQSRKSMNQSIMNELDDDVDDDDDESFA